MKARDSGRETDLGDGRRRHSKGTKNLFFDVAPDFHVRIKRCADHLRMTIATFAREALFYRVEHYEYKIYQQQMIAKNIQEPDGGPSGTRVHSQTKTLEQRREERAERKAAAKAAELVEPSAPVDPLAPLYLEHARLILGTIDPVEMRRRTEAAVSAIRAARPLTAPPDGEILRALEEYCIEVRRKIATAPPPAPTYDSFIDRLTKPLPPPTNG